jgi:hypothetical protein
MCQPVQHQTAPVLHGCAEAAPRDHEGTRSAPYLEGRAATPALPDRDFIAADILLAVVMESILSLLQC